MNFNQRIDWINRSLTKAVAKRTALIAEISDIRKSVKEIVDGLDKIDNEMYRIEDLGVDWALLVDVLESDACVIQYKLEILEDRLDDAEASLDVLEGHIEVTSYSAVDAASVN